MLVIFRGQIKSYIFYFSVSQPNVLNSQQSIRRLIKIEFHHLNKPFKVPDKVPQYIDSLKLCRLQKMFPSMKKELVSIIYFLEPTLSK